MSPKIEHKKMRALSGYDEHSLEKNKSNEQYDDQQIDVTIDSSSINKNQSANNLDSDELILISDVDENGLAYGKLK